jgi:hypothetical protein
MYQESSRFGLGAKTRPRRDTVGSPPTRYGGRLAMRASDSDGATSVWRIFGYDHGRLVSSGMAKARSGWVGDENNTKP